MCLGHFTAKEEFYFGEEALIALATITSQGRVTIPKPVRDSLGLSSGDKIEITVTEEGVAVIRPISKKVDDVFGKLHKPDRRAASIEEMNRVVRQQMKDRLK